MKQQVKSVIGWHEVLNTLAAFVNNYDGSHFSLFDAGLLENTAKVIRGKVEILTQDKPFKLPDVQLKIRNVYPPGIVPLDFTLEENKHLLEPLTKYGRRFRRGPAEQAMMVVEELLTKEGLI
jgi:hypothetical protein